MNKLSWMMIGALVAFGCGDDDSSDSTTIPGADSGALVEMDSGTPLSCQDRVPVDGFGTIDLSYVENFTLQQCDGTEYSFYNEDFCEAELTVVTIAAGWCMPCILESSMLEAEINEVYRDQGVRVIQVITQTRDYTAPDLAYCSEWVDRFGLTNIQLIDPIQLTSRYFPDGVLPSTLIISRDGQIIKRENGLSEGLLSLREEIDAALAM